MFYRRKLVLALFEKVAGNLEETRLQKLLFLLTREQSSPAYDFVPYKYGCYSYSLKADLRVMVQKDWLNLSEEGYSLSTERNYLGTLNSSDHSILSDTVDSYRKMSIKDITRHTYLNFPYYAINSTIAKSILSAEHLKEVENARPSSSQTVLYTIGYEGISLEAYLNKLIRNDVKLLVDVRRNPFSRKYGFSKRLLSDFCDGLGIGYIHIPEVGIDSSKRQELNIQEDYDALFKEYRNTVLLETSSAQQKILDLLEEHKRIALTCFEADKCQCHRSYLAEKLQESLTSGYLIRHL